MAGALGRLCAVYTPPQPHDSDASSFPSTTSLLDDLNALSGIPLALRNLLRGAFRDTVMAQDAAILDASGSRWLLLDCQVIR